MKKTTLIFVSIFLISCNELLLGDDPENSPESTFETFWHGVNLTWPAFEQKKLNWDSVYQLYRPQVNANTTHTELRNILTNMMYALRDPHTSLYPKGSVGINYYPPYPKNFYGIEWIRRNYVPTYRGNRSLLYGLIRSDIGYIYIGTFGNGASDYQIIDTIIEQFKNTKGIIIDVRSNGGGNSANSEIIASRFVRETKIFAYAQWRDGKDRNSLSKFYTSEISPANKGYSNKVVVLLNRYSFSATEDFLLMMKTQPEVVFIGDPSGGGSESRPLMKELPNGWTYRVSSRLIYDGNKKTIRAGIEPTFRVQASKSDSLNFKDSIIEKAITLVNQ